MNGSEAKTPPHRTMPSLKNFHHQSSSNYRISMTSKQIGAWFHYYITSMILIGRGSCRFSSICDVSPRDTSTICTNITTIRRYNILNSFSTRLYAYYILLKLPMNYISWKIIDCAMDSRWWWMRYIYIDTPLFSLLFHINIRAAASATMGQRSNSYPHHTHCALHGHQTISQSSLQSLPRLTHWQAVIGLGAYFVYLG